MNDFDDLDDLFGELRSAATDAELAGEPSYVDAMARRHRRQKGHTMFTSRRARVATFVAAGVIGFGGVAAAGPGGPLALTGSDDTTTTSEAPATTSEVPTTTSEVTTTTSEVALEDAAITQSVIEEIPAADDAAPVDDPDPDTEFDESRCLDGNHGKTVSAVARGEEGFEDVEQRVVAQSSCGKDRDHGDDGDDGEEAEEADDIDDIDDIDDSDGDDDDSGRPEKSGRPESPGKSDERGNGSKKHSDD